MNKLGLLAISLAFGASLTACGGRSSAVSSPLTPAMPLELSFTLPDNVPKNTIGEGLPNEAGIGSKTDRTWGKICCYTQTKRAQVLTFPPGTTVTIRNLSTVTPHTLNAIAKATKPPAKWPANPNLSFTPHGGGKLSVGYASGSINPGSSVKVKLVKAGTYLIGCAYHYVSNNMRDVLVVKAGATPSLDFER